MKKKNDTDHMTRPNHPRVITMQSGTKRKHDIESESSSSDESWAPSSSDDNHISLLQVRTRSRGPVEKPPDPTAAMDAADDEVDNESDLSSDTEEDEDESSEEDEGEEEEEESNEDDYSDDDSFVTSNEDAELEEREEVSRSYSKVFDGEEDDGDDEEEPATLEEQILQPTAPEEDLSIGGYLATAGDM